MAPDATTVALLGVLFAATFVRATFGFADALFAMPLLALFLDMKTATPLVALATHTVGFALLLSHWRHVNVASAWRLILASAVGIPLGAHYLQEASGGLLEIVLGVTVGGFALWSLAKPRLLALRTDRWSYVFGFLGGMLGGAYNTSGPPVVMYGTLRGWAPLPFRATLQGYFLANGVLILLVHCSKGLWTCRVLSLYGLSLPVCGLALLLGTRLSRSFQPERFNRYVYVLLLAMGLLLVVRRVVG